MENYHQFNVFINSISSTVIYEREDVTPITLSYKKKTAGRDILIKNNLFEFLHFIRKSLKQL